MFCEHSLLFVVTWLTTCNAVAVNPPGFTESCEDNCELVR